MAARSKIDDELKREVVEQLLRRQKTVAQVVAEHKLHPYQVRNWVGEATLEEGGFGRKYRISSGGTLRPPTGPASDMEIMVAEQVIGEKLEGRDPMRAIGEWYVRTHVLKNLPGLSGKRGGS